ncbi:hypothetical protein KR222_011723, partial [Zaprionus bogoriensis]
MSSIPLWVALALLLGLASATAGSSSSSGSGSGSSSIWQRAFFGRNSRNLRHRNPAVSSTVESGADAGLSAFDAQQQQQQQQQQAEVYGIVEPLIEDTPCANRACLLNEDCCPAGVCVNTYGEGKCVYVFGRQRDLCQRHADCAPGSACVLSPQEGIWHCEADAPLLQDVFGSLRPRQPLGSDCSSSSDCQVINGMCCQQQRLHHRGNTKLSCGYFRDAFDCVDVAQEVSTT